MKKILKNLSMAQNVYQTAIGLAEQKIVDKVEFEFSIFWQPSDGFVLQYDNYNAPLQLCLEVIEQKGRLSFEDYIGHTI